METKINNSVTTQYKVVFSNMLNDQNNLFGGIAMQWMDEVSYITAMRFTRKKMVTVTTDKIKFLKPVKAGEIVQLIGKVVKVGLVKITIQVELFSEQLDTGIKQKAIEGFFVFAAVDTNNKPIRI
ncbi:acyl-CoA thioesterase [Lutibacter sp. A80]|uniref:acyl-CoA thioesterase n=1 Tax=Lutibacter sp. A80 TaxID=2918453 RepID=UPI001F0643D4|nr:hotdog domain-containing protein [Lutibacter sp. A80]UMB59388.1 acyl-CoA thioesterase [Lutibacter sp. A80]